MLYLVQQDMFNTEFEEAVAFEPRAEVYFKELIKSYAKYLAKKSCLDLFHEYTARVEAKGGWTP